MNKLEEIVSIFTEIDKISRYHEDFSIVRLKVESDSLNLMTVEDLHKSLQGIPIRDSIELILTTTKDYFLDDLSKVEEFVSSIKEDYFEDGDKVNEYFELELTVTKGREENCVSIYDFSSIEKTLRIENLEDVLTSLSNILIDGIFPNFILISDERFFCTKTIYFYNESFKDDIEFIEVDRSKIITKRKANCNFLDEKVYGFIPEDFSWQIKPKEKELQNLFKLLKYLFSVVSLANIASLKDNNLEVTFEGYKKLNETINCQEIFGKKNNLDVLIETYRKCYIGGEISDRIGIVRNLLPINVENSILQINPEFNVSIDSNYKIYLKENVIRYIEIKQGIVQNLTDAIQKSNNISGSFYEDLKKNLFAFLTFFVTILIFNTTNSGKLENIFTRDIATISYVLLFFSLLFLYLSYNVASRRKIRFCENYKSLKVRYKDLLDQNDIENIFNHDEEHKKNKLQINKGIKEATIIWILSVMILFSMVLFLQVSKSNIKDKSNSSKNVNVTIISTENSSIRKSNKGETTIEPQILKENDKVKVIESIVAVSRESKSKNVTLDSIKKVNDSILKTDEKK